MRKILAVGLKEFRQIARDRRPLMVLLFVPAFFLLLYGYALNFDVQNIQLVVHDNDRTPASRELVDSFVNSGYFNVIADVSSRPEYEELIDALIPQTQRAIRVFDRSLSRSWNSSSRCAALRHFLLASRLNRLYIVVHDVQAVEREFPRLLDLNQHFSAAVLIHETLNHAKHVYDPFVVFDSSHYVHRFHYRHLRAAHGANDLIGAQQLLDRYAEIWEASARAVSAGTSGL